MLKRIIVFVANVEACAEFYETCFGLRRKPGAQAGEWIELDGGGCGLAFHRARGMKGPTGSERNPHKIVFEAKDVAAKREELVGKGVKMGEVKKFGELVLCDGKDVEGHVFQISNRT